MATNKDVKRGSKSSSKKQRVRKQSRQAKPTSKSTTRPSDVYEAEENDPQEEIKAGQRYDRVDNYEYELPSDFEDEEIDEEAAFTEADKRQFADWFGDDPAAGDTAPSEDASEHDLLNSDSEDIDEEELNPDDYSEDEFEQLQSARRKSASATDAHTHRKNPASQAPAANVEADSEAESSGPPSDEEVGSEEGESDEEEDEEVVEGEEEDSRHQAMLAEVTGAVSNRKRKRTAIATEAYPDSEYNLPPSSGPAGELSIADMMRGLGDAKSKLGPARKALMKMAKQAEPLATPLPGPIWERQERKAGYETTKEDITKWQPLVKANREAPTLEFKSNKDEIMRSSTTAALAAKFTPDNDMEEEVAELLRAAGAHTGEAVEEAEEALALKALTVEEARERRERMAKMRSLLFAHEQKSKRLKAIKSKGFHRHAKKAAKMKALKAGETGDDDIIRLAAEDAELARAKERLTLKHRNSSKWARRALKRGMDVMDEGTKAAVAEQLRLGEELRRKVDRIDDKSGSEHSDSDDSTSASDEEADDKPASSRKRAASNKARAAALDILQGGAEQGEGEGVQPKTGLFSLPFMTRAAERQRLNAQQEAAALLAQLEAEDEQAAAGSDREAGAAAEPQGWGSASGNAGRMAFGTGPASARQGVSDDEAASSSGEEEDAEAKAARLGMRMAGGGAAASRPSRRAEGISATASKKRKRARDAVTAPGEEDSRDNRLASSSGPMAVDQADFNAGSALPGGTPGLHARAFGTPSQGPSAQAHKHSQAAAAVAAASSQPGSVHVGPLSAADARTDRREQEAQQALPAFVKAKAFSGGKAGYAFKKGSKGVGYYLEAGAVCLPVSKLQKQSEMLPGKSGMSKKQQQQQQQQGKGEEKEEDKGAEAMSDEDMQPVKGIELSQAELIKRAFAGDDVQADFEAAKAAEIEEELPKQDEISVLPGWGSWAGQQKEPHWMKAANQKAQKQKEAAAASRKDSKLKAVVISEAWDKKSSKYNSPSLPFPFDCKTTYEQSMRTPMGREFNTTAAHRDMTRPAVIKHSGMIIDPIKFNKAAADTAKQTKAKSRKMKVSVSAGIPRPSRR